MRTREGLGFVTLVNSTEAREKKTTQTKWMGEKEKNDSKYLIK